MKRTYALEVELRNAEIRKAEVIENSFKDKKTGEDKVSRKIELAIDDENLNRIYLYDKCIENLEMYKRGAIGTFKLKINVEEDFGTKCQINLIAFKPATK